MPSSPHHQYCTGEKNRPINYFSKGGGRWPVSNKLFPEPCAEWPKKSANHHLTTYFYKLNYKIDFTILISDNRCIRLIRSIVLSLFIVWDCLKTSYIVILFYTYFFRNRPPVNYLIFVGGRPMAGFNFINDASKLTLADGRFFFASTVINCSLLSC